jgi:hypothetical protein
MASKTSAISCAVLLGALEEQVLDEVRDARALVPARPSTRRRSKASATDRTCVRRSVTTR